MVGLRRAVDDLVQAVAAGTEPRALRKNVERVLDGFDGADATTRAAALKTIGRALGDATGAGAQVLCLALGALVEGGASPELAWPAVAKGLTTILERATTFVKDVLKQAKSDDVETAVRTAGSVIGKKRPDNAHAWNAAPARALAAIACLTRSKTLRAKVRNDASLVRACVPLSEVVAEIGLLLQAIRIVDDETWLILAPAEKTGWRVSIDGLASNGELYVLLANVILDGKRAEARAVEALKKGTAPKKAVMAQIPFDLVAGEPLSEDGLPADIPRVGRERIVFVSAASFMHEIPITPSFEGLGPQLEVVDELEPDEVDRILLKLSPKKKTSAKKTSSASARSSKPKAAAKRRA